MSSTPLPIIHINGFPGTGKLTIARHLQKILGDRCRLVHNHLLINPADAVLHRTESGYQMLRKAIRTAILSTLVDNEETHKNLYVLTDFQSSDATGSATCSEILEATKARGSALIPVVLTCDEEANLKRLQAAERVSHGKMVDAGLLKYFRQGSHIHRFRMDTSLELDVSDLSAEEAAQRILDHVFKLLPDVKEALAVTQLS